MCLFYLQNYSVQLLWYFLGQLKKFINVITNSKFVYNCLFLYLLVDFLPRDLVTWLKWEISSLTQYMLYVKLKMFTLTSTKFKEIPHWISFDPCWHQSTDNKSVYKLFVSQKTVKYDLLYLLWTLSYMTPDNYLRLIFQKGDYRMTADIQS